MSLPNVGEVTANLLYGEGYRSLEDIAFADQELLSKTAGVEDMDEIEKIQTAARIALKDKLEKMTVEVEDADTTKEPSDETEIDADADDKGDVKEETQ